MSQKVFVTGLGAISAIGDNVNDQYQSLVSGKSGISEIAILKTVFKGELLAGEVKYTNEELHSMTGADKNILFTRTELLAIIAAKEAMKDAELEGNNPKTGFISATSVGGMCSTEDRYYKYLEETGPADYVPLIEQHGCGEGTDRITEILNISGFHTTISTACSSSANSIMLGARLIKQGLLDQVVVGGVDALTKFTVNGFRSLMILDKEQCKPFDNERRGLNLGEGAGFIVLESEESVKKRGKKPYCQLSGYANTNDAFHQTASSPQGEGAYMAMKSALALANVKVSEIDYINAHGTGTEVNDLSEGNALENLFNNNVPAFSSTKSFTGHTLAASGGLEAVYSVLAIDRKTIFPNIYWKTPMSEVNIRPIIESKREIELNHVLSNSFGFGGNTSALLFSRN